MTSSPPITAHLVAGAGAVGAHAEVAALPGLGRHVAVVQRQHLRLVTETDSLVHLLPVWNSEMQKLGKT